MDLADIIKTAPADIHPTLDDPHAIIGSWLPADEKAAQARREYRNRVAAFLASSRTALFLGVLAACFDPHLVREAVAQDLCGRRADIIKELGDRYAEASIGLGIANNGSLVELLTGKRAKDAPDTWTIMVTEPNGLACLLAAGEDWQPIERIKPQGPQL